jgi:membrane protein YqaA with SNARE-associated domain
MTCYGIGRLGKPEWIAKLGVSEAKIEKAHKFLAGRGAMMAFFCFLPTIGEAIAITLGLMRSNIWITAGSMLVGKTIRYIFVILLYFGAVSLFFK